MREGTGERSGLVVLKDISPAGDGVSNARALVAARFYRSNSTPSTIGAKVFEATRSLSSKAAFWRIPRRNFRPKRIPPRDSDSK